MLCSQRRNKNIRRKGTLLMKQGFLFSDLQIEWKKFNAGRISVFSQAFIKMTSDPSTAIRLNKAISDTGFCSRREADKIIEQGRVTINGHKAALGSKVMPGDVVKVDGRAIKNPQKTIYIA